MTDESNVRSGSQTARCRECGRAIGAGYLCDDCDIVEVER